MMELLETDFSRYIPLDVKSLILIGLIIASAIVFMRIVRVIGLGDSSVNLRSVVWTKHPASSVQLRSDLLRSIKYQYDRGGVEIPFPYRTLVYKKDLTPNATTDDE